MIRRIVPAIVALLVIAMAGCGDDNGGGSRPGADVELPDAVPDGTLSDTDEPADVRPDDGGDGGPGDVPDTTADTDTSETDGGDLPDGDVIDGDTLDVGDANGDVEPDVVDPQPTGEGTVAGRVTDLAGWPLEGVVIRISGRGVSAGEVAVTGADGHFSFIAPAGIQVAVRFELPGYAPDTKPVRMTVENARADLFPVLVRRDTPQSLDARAGGTIVGRTGARVVVPGDALVHADGTPVEGAVDVYLTPVNYNEPNGFSAFPGLADAVTADGENVWMESFGVVELAFQVGEEPVFLDEGQSATLTIPISTQNDGQPAGSTAGLWELNPETGLWDDRGDAEVTSVTGATGGRGITVPVPRGGWWNCDIGVAPIIVPLRVVIRGEGEVVPVEGPWGVQVTFPTGAGRGRAEVARVVEPSGGEAAITVPVAGAFIVQVLVPSLGRAGLVQIDAYDPESPEIEIELGPEPPLVELVTDEPREIELAADAYVRVRATVPAGALHALQQERLLSAQAQRWDVAPVSNARAFELPAATTWLPMPAGNAAPVTFEYLYRAIVPGTLRLTAQSPAAFADIFDQEREIDLDGSPSELRILVREGSWLRVTSQWTDGSVPGTPTVSIVSPTGATVNGLGSGVGDTGAVRIPASGVYVVRFSGSVPARTARYRVMRLPEPLAIPAGREWRELVQFDEPGSGRLWTVPLPVGHVFEARATPSAPGVESLPGRLVLGGLPLNGWNQFSVTFLPVQTIRTGDLPAGMAVSRSASQALATGVVYVALSPFETGDLDVRINALGTDDRFLLGEGPGCEDAISTSLPAAGLALAPGGVITLCGDFFDAAHGRILPQAGTIETLDPDAFPEVRLWSGRSVVRADTVATFGGVTLRNLDLQFSGSGNAGIDFTLGIPSGDWTIELENLRIEHAGGGGTALSVAPSGASLGQLVARDVTIRRFMTGVNAVRLLRADLEGMEIVDATSAALSLSTNVHTRVASSTIVSRGQAITLNSTETGSWEIVDNVVDVSEGINVGIFVAGNQPGPGPWVIRGNEVLVSSATTANAGIVVLRPPNADVTIDGNTVRPADGTTLRVGIDIRDNLVNPAPSLGRLVVQNNIVRGAVLQGILLAAADIGTVLVAHNTLVGGGSFSSRVNLLQLSTRGSTFTGALPLTVQSNYFVGGGLNRDAGVQVPRAGVTFTATTNATSNLALPDVVAGTATAVGSFGDDTVAANGPPLDADGCVTGDWPGRDTAAQNASVPATDRFGVTRPQGAGPDIGACEAP